MQTINQLTANLTTLTNSEQKQQLSTETHSQTQANSERSINLVIDLFEDWLRMYGSKLKERQTLDLRTAELWTLAIKNSGITLKEFNQAAELSLNLKWPPTAAQDFIELIRQNKPSEYPAAQTAFNTACQNCGMRGDVKRDWKHEVIYETANRIGWGILASATEYYFKTFQEIYEQVVSEHRNGDRFVIPEERQLAYEHTPVQQGTAASANIDAFLAKFGSKKGEAV